MGAEVEKRNGFTLVELLITVAIIGIMASMIVFAMFSAQEAAREQKTRMLITKLNNIVMQRWESYRTRRVPIQFTNAEAKNAPLAAKMRIDCLRDLMRMEMPDRWSDVKDDPVAPFTRAAADKLQRPAVNQAYLALATAGTPTEENQGAECLYMMVMQSLAQEGDSREVFKANDSADTDNDGYPEFIDAWGRPIQFIRWAPGFQSPLQTPIQIIGQITAGASPQEYIVKVASGVAGSKKLSSTPGSYVGGTLALVNDATGIIDTRYSAKITGYSYEPGTPSPTVRFTCTTPASTQQKPFGSSPPSGGKLVVLQPDPFDSRGVYPMYNPGSASPPSPDTSVPTYAIYPLILSGGRDKAFGIVDDAATASASRIHYANASDVALNPFFVPQPVSEDFGLMLGSVINKNAVEQGWYKGCDLDNITSHSLTQR